MKTYEFSTIQDIFDRIPSDRMADFFSELGEVFSMLKRMEESAPKIKRRIKIPMEWKDDGRGELVARVELNNGTFIKEEKVLGGK